MDHEFKYGLTLSIRWHGNDQTLSIEVAEPWGGHHHIIRPISKISTNHDLDEAKRNLVLEWVEAHKEDRSRFFHGKPLQVVFGDGYEETFATIRVKEEKATE